MSNDEDVVSGEIVEAGALTIKTSDNLSPAEKIAQVTAAVAQMQALQKVVRGAALGCTRPGDWRSWNGRLRPEVSAANSIAAMFGVKVTDVTTEKKTTNNGYQVVAHGTFMLPLSGFTLEQVMGSCRSDDDIVATRYDYDKETQKREKRDVPSGDVDEATVIKKALANMMVNGIMSLFGLRNVTPEELKAAGINLAGDGDVKFSKKAWEISEGQSSILKKFFATDAEIDACKSNADITNLMNKVKAEKRKGPAAAPASAGQGTATQPPAAAPASETAESYEQTVLDNLQELAEALQYTPEMAKIKIDGAKAKGMTGLRSLQAAWAELVKAKK